MHGPVCASSTRHFTEPLNAAAPGRASSRERDHDMKIHDPRRAAAAAAVARADRPATATMHDSADVRLVVFRIEPGQHVATHTSVSTVVLTVLEGTGFVTGTEGER